MKRTDRIRHKTLLTTSTALACICASPSSSFGQTVPTTQPAPITPPTAAASGREVTEVIVTARKISERLQDVPLSVTALTSGQLAARDIRDVYSLQNSVPNFSFDKAFGRRNDRPSLRGQSNIQGEPNAAFFVDGAYVSGSITGTSTENLERIEILRGPQAALFGRATFAGAINYVTRQPTDDWKRSINARAGQNGDYRVGGWVSGAIIPGIVQIYLGASSQSYDGEYRNNNLGSLASEGLILVAPTRADNSRVGSEKQTNVTGRLRVIASPVLEFNLKAERAETDDSHLAAVFIGGDQLNCFLPVAGTSTARSRGYYCGIMDVGARQPTFNIPDFEDGLTGTAGVSLPEPAGNRRETARWLGDVRYTPGEWDFFLQGSFNTDDAIFATDADYTIRRPLGAILHAVEDLRFRNQSAEFRITTPRNVPIRGQFGLYWFDERLQSRTRGLGLAPITFRADGSDFTVSTVENYAAFAQIQWQVNNALTLSGEARSASEKRAVSTTRPASATFESFTPRVTIDYKISDRNLVYGLVAQGNKPGGFNTALYSATGVSQASFEALQAQGLDRFDEETATTYEIGSKNSFAQGRGTFNLSAFQIHWEKQQLTKVVDIVTATNVRSTAAILINAGKSRILGLEAELTYAVTPRLLVSASYGLADSEIQAFNDGEIAILTGVDDPNLLQGGNAKGKALPNTPRDSFSLSTNYTLPLNINLTGFFDGNFRYEAKRYGQVDNLYWTGDVALLNGRVGVRSANWEIALYGDNLLDDDTPTGIGRTVDRTQPNFVGGTRRGFSLGLRRGREAGVTARFNF